MIGRVRARARASPVYYGWFVVGACFLAIVVLFGATFSFGVFFEPIQSAYGGSRAGVAALFSLQTFVLYAGAAVTGGLVDRYGTRRSMAFGGLLLAGGLAVAALVRPFLAFAVAFGVVAALGLSLLHVVGYATVPRWFGRRRGFASGVATAGLGIGMFVVEPTASWLVAAIGWRETYLALAGVFLGLVGVATAFVADSPDSLGIDASDEFGTTGPRDGPSGRRVRDLARTPSFVLVFVGWVLIYSTLFTLLSHLVPHADDLAIRWAGVWALSLLGLVSVFSRLGIGYLADRVGGTRAFVASSLGMGATMLLLPGARSPALLLAFAVAYAVGFGGNGALLSVVPAELFGVEDINTTFGLTLSAFAVAGLSAPYLAGLVYDATGTYTPAFRATGAFAVLGATLVWFAGRLAPANP